VPEPAGYSARAASGATTRRIVSEHFFMPLNAFYGRSAVAPLPKDASSKLGDET
jgi:hypothetical protein